jgi:hypothetical protein
MGCSGLVAHTATNTEHPRRAGETEIGGRDVNRG